MLRRRAFAPAFAVLTALALAACTPDGGVATPTPTELTEEQAYAAAEDALRAYVDALNAVDVSDPTTFEPLYALSTGEQNAQDREQYSTWHADHWSQLGEATLSIVQPSMISPDRNDVTLAICLDVSSVDVIDETGQSVVDPDRVRVQTVSATIDRSAGGGSWRVKNFSPRDGEPTCS